MVEPLSTGAFLGGTLGSAALGGIGSMLGISSQQRANEENMKLNRELLSFQKYQYEDQKKYNSMAEQVRRIRSAGLNPSLMMQSGTIGTSGTAVGSPSLQPMQPLDIGSIANGFADVARVGSDSIADIARAGKDIQEAIGTAKDNLYKDDNWHWTIDNKKALSYMQGMEGEVSRMTADFLSKSMGDRLMQQRWQTELTRAESGLKLIAESFAKPEAQARIYNLLATGYSAVLTGQASVKQAYAAIKNAITNENNSFAMYGFDDDDRAEFLSATLDQLHSASDENWSTAYKNGYTPWSFNIGSDMIGHVAYNTVEGHHKDMRDTNTLYRMQHTNGVLERHKRRKMAQKK